MTTDTFTAESIKLEQAIRLLSGRHDVIFNMALSTALAERSSAAHYLATRWPHLALSKNPAAKRYAAIAMGEKGLGVFLDKDTAQVAMYFFDSKGLDVIDSKGEAPAPLHEPLLLKTSPATHNALAGAIERELSVMLGIEEGSGI